MKIASFDVREWINPNTDRRPMTEDWVLMTLRCGDHYIVRTDRYLLDLKEMLAEYDADMVAWMPLPEPYDGERREECY